MGSDFEISPMRSINDFILESARFDLPNLKDLEKWSNRVVNNLLYYQTNYFVTYLVVFLLIGLIQPGKLLLGMIVVLACFGLFYYVTTSAATARQFKRNHPVISLALIFAVGYLLMYMFRSVLIFLLGILLPILVIFIHASLRLRNVKNKVANRIEQIGFKKTPMGIILDALDLHQVGKTYGSCAELIERQIHNLLNNRCEKKD